MWKYSASQESNEKIYGFLLHQKNGSDRERSIVRDRYHSFLPSLRYYDGTIFYSQWYDYNAKEALNTIRGNTYIKKYFYRYHKSLAHINRR